MHLNLNELCISNLLHIAIKHRRLLFNVSRSSIKSLQADLGSKNQYVQDQISVKLSSFFKLEFFNARKKFQSMTFCF